MDETKTRYLFLTVRNIKEVGNLFIKKLIGANTDKILNRRDFETLNNSPKSFFLPMYLRDFKQSLKNFPSNSFVVNSKDHFLRKVSSRDLKFS